MVGAHCRCLDIFVDCRQTFGAFGCDRTRSDEKVLVFDGMSLETCMGKCDEPGKI